MVPTSHGIGGLVQSVRDEDDNANVVHRARDATANPVRTLCGLTLKRATTVLRIEHMTFAADCPTCVRLAQEGG